MSFQSNLHKFPRFRSSVNSRYGAALTRQGTCNGEATECEGKWIYTVIQPVAQGTVIFIEISG